jgi:hypothetical protein
MEHGDPPTVIYALHRRGEHLRATQHPPEGHHDVAGLDGACRGLGQERLVGHVGLRVNDRDRGLAGAQLLL